LPAALVDRLAAFFLAVRLAAFFFVAILMAPLRQVPAIPVRILPLGYRARGSRLIRSDHERTHLSPFGVAPPFVVSLSR
jgi:hypothetical protein